MAVLLTQQQMKSLLRNYELKMFRAHARCGLHLQKTCTLARMLRLSLLCQNCMMTVWHCTAEWNMHVAKSLGPYDMIIGRDILKFLQIDLRFSDEVIEWDGAEMPFGDGDASAKEAHHVADSDPSEDAVHRVKRILDAKCEKADNKRICQEQAELDQTHQAQLAALLCKHEALFDGQLGRLHGQEVKVELKEGAKHCHARAHDTP